MTFFIYGRKSVYTGKGESIENQIEMCRQYIASRFAAEAERRVFVYEDEGFSAKNTERPQFQKMLRDLRRLRPEYIVCYRLDRISRSVSDFAALIENLNHSGISFICIKEEFDTSRPMGKAMMYIASVFAQLERETIAERVRDNMLMLARGGRWLGGTPPTGYAAGKTQEILLDGKSKSFCILQENPAEADTVRQIFAAYQKRRSISAVCRFLTSRGFLTRSGKPYAPAVVRQILKNPVYCTADEDAFLYFTQKGAEVCFKESEFGENRGLIAYNKRDYKKGGAPRRPAEEWIIASGTHPGLIPGAQWVLVQKLLGDGGGKPHNDYSLLSGMLFCGACGAAMYAKPRKAACGGTVSFDYICRTKLKGSADACSCRNLNGPAADRAVMESLTEKLPDPQTCRKQLENLLGKWNTTESAAQISQNKIRNAEREIEALLLLLPERKEESAFVVRVEQRINSLENEIARWKQICAADPSGEPDELRRSEAHAKALELLDLKRFLPALPLLERRSLLRLFCQKAVWDGTILHLY